MMASITHTYTLIHTHTLSYTHTHTHVHARTHTQRYVPKPAALRSHTENKDVGCICFPHIPRTTHTQLIQLRKHTHTHTHTHTDIHRSCIQTHLLPFCSHSSYGWNTHKRAHAHAHAHTHR